MTLSRLVRFLAVPVGVLLVGFANPVSGGSGDLPLLDYRTESWFLPQTPGVTAGPVAGLFNPGAAALTDRSGFDLWLYDRGGDLDLHDFGFAVGRHLQLAMNRQTFDWQGHGVRRDDWQLGLARSTRRGAAGLAYRWSGGPTNGPRRDRTLVAGLVSRPGRGFSLGAARAMSLEADAAQNVFDLGLRPFGTSALTLFADWTANDGDRFFGDGVWGAGLEVRPLRGLNIGLRARERIDSDDVDYAVMVGVTTHRSQSSGAALYDGDGNHLQTTYLLRSRPPLAGGDLTPGWFDRAPRYFALSLENKSLTYQKHRLFDDEHVAWLDLLRVLNSLRDDARLDIVTINLSGLRARPSLIWELRAKLLEIRRAGKELHIHGDRLSLAHLYLATAADHLTLDPQGMISVPGIVLTRSYLKGTLEKLGVGFQEHRYFKYKSAAETLSRDRMSEADREQRQRVTDVLYEVMRDGVADGRGLRPDEIDTVVDEMTSLTPAEALDAGLIDAVDRWDRTLEALQAERGAVVSPLPERIRRTWWDEQWGRPPRIPVVYALGSCAMDEGIKGRATSAYLRRLASDPSVVAVVLRADSPGGDPLPSDLVAGAVRQLKAAGKPVVISQGDVAASGGYWISMDGSRILTTPLTVTGSIGVISGWLWSDGLADKAGVTADAVHRGRHADLYSNVRLPLVGGLPRRPMNDTELARVETVIRGMYDDFVGAVATGRGLDVATVRDLAQGRVWMGGDALEIGLCDAIGGLDDAIEEARRLAGVPDGREVDIVEYPPRPWIRWPSFGPRLPALLGLEDRVNGWLTRLFPTSEIGVDGAPDSGSWSELGLTELETDYLRRLAAEPGRPQLLVAPDLVPEAWQGLD